MRRFSLCLFLLALSVARAQVRNEVNLVNNGYETVLIAIHESVPEDYSIITRLKQIFTDASTAMYTATKKRAYFRNVTILVPTTWSHRPEYEKQTWEAYSISNVIVDKPHSVYGHNPYVKQTGPCGVGGEYIHFTSDFLVNATFAEDNWGPSEKTVVHEWGHYRWGLFDEYADTAAGELDFYFVWGSIEPVRCSVSINGPAKDITTGGGCKFDPAIMNFDANCRFFPTDDPSVPVPLSSMMYRQYLSQIYEFCDSVMTDNNKIMHNPEAPNKMNSKCSHLSSWEVMRKHKDFSSGANPPKTLTPAEVVPNIKVVQHYNISAPSKRRVLLLDVSGSMGLYGRKEKMIQAAADFILNVAEIGSELGLVSFSSTARILLPMTEIKDNSTRQMMINLIPKFVGGGTGIGAGVVLSSQVLAANGADPAGGIILLLTDGEENIAPFIADIDNQTAARGVKVDGIAMGQRAEINIGSLAAKTNSYSFYDTENTNSMGIYESYQFSAIKRMQGDKLVVIESIAANVVPNTVHNGRFIMDNSVGYTTTASFFYPLGVPVTVTLTAPDGTVYDSNSGAPIYLDNTMYFTVRITIPSVAQPGNWTYTISSTVGGTIGISIKSRADPTNSASNPIQVHGWYEKGGVSFNPTAKGAVMVFAEVLQGFSPLANVDVKAVITCTNCVPQDVPLFDTGAGSDVARYDGIYSGYFVPSQMTKNGRYDLKFSVISTSGNVLTINSGGSLAASTNLATGNATTQPTSNFQRVSSGGALAVSNFGTGSTSDVISPSRVDDLKLVYTSYDDYHVIVKWTSVGDDLVTGNATRYELKASENFTELLHDFNTAPSMSSAFTILSCPLSSPSPPGRIEVCSFLVPNRGPAAMYYFAVRAHDDVGNTADVSNIIPVGLVEHLPPDMEEHKDEGVSTGVAVGIGVVALAALLLSIGCGVCLYAAIRRRNKRKTEDESKFRHLGTPTPPKGVCYHAHA